MAVQYYRVFFILATLILVFSQKENPGRLVESRLGSGRTNFLIGNLPLEIH